MLQTLALITLISLIHIDNEALDPSSEDTGLAVSCTLLILCVVVLLTLIGSLVLGEAGYRFPALQKLGLQLPGEMQKKAVI